MPNLLSLGQKGPGTVLTNAYQIGAEWDGTLVAVWIEIPTNQDTANRSVEFVVELSDNETGPWSHQGGIHWVGERPPGKFGGPTIPGMAWIVTGDMIGKWVRGRMELPVRMRCGIDIDARPPVV